MKLNSASKLHRDIELNQICLKFKKMDLKSEEIHNSATVFLLGMKIIYNTGIVF